MSSIPAPTTGLETRPRAAAPTVPTRLRLLRTAFQIAGHAAPRPTSRWAFDLFSTPRRYPQPAREAALLAEARPFTVPHRGLELAAASWGEGPDVLLVHGWNGRGAQLGAFVPPLVGAGFRVTTFDAPAHGRSGGTRTNLYDFAAAIQAVAAALGPLHGVVTHSFGGASTTLALSRGLGAGAVVHLAPASRVEGAIFRFAELLAVPEPTVRELRGIFERRFGAGVWRELDAERMAATLDIPALVFHDPKDDEIPFADGVRLATVWPGARLIPTPGLGHRRILWDERVLAPSVEFIVHRGQERPTVEHELAAALPG